MEKITLIQPVMDVEMAEGMVCDPITGMCGPALTETNQANEDVKGTEEE